MPLLPRLQIPAGRRKSAPGPKAEELKVSITSPVHPATADITSPAFRVRAPEGDIASSDYSTSVMSDESRNFAPIEIGQKGVCGGIGKF